MIKEVNEPCDCPFRVSENWVYYCNLNNDITCIDKHPENCPLLKEDITVMFISIKGTQKKMIEYKNECHTCGYTWTTEEPDD